MSDILNSCDNDKKTDFITFLSPWLNLTLNESFMIDIRAREKKGIGITDVTAFDQLDGVVANQEPIKMQQSKCF